MILHPESPKAYSHSELEVRSFGEPNNRDKELKAAFVARARDMEGENVAIFLARVMENVVDLARQRRYDHHHQSMQLQGLYPGGLNAHEINRHRAHVTAQDVIPLLDHFFAIVQELDASGSLPAKGISTEIGHIDQYGMWEVAHGLDETVRQAALNIGSSEIGLKIIREYDRSDPLTQYIFTSIRLPDEGYNIGGYNIPDIIPIVLGIRKRPIADLAIEAFPELVIECVKRSSFVIVPHLLTSRQREFLELTLADLGDREFARYAGAAIIEGALLPGQREQQLAVSPISALYFARMRPREITQEPVLYLGNG